MIALIQPPSVMLETKTGDFGRIGRDFNDTYTADVPVETSLEFCALKDSVKLVSNFF